METYFIWALVENGIVYLSGPMPFSWCELQMEIYGGCCHALSETAEKICGSFEGLS